MNGLPGAKIGELEPSTGDGFGFFQRYENGAIYWREDLAAYWILGAIYDKYIFLGGAAGLLGHPVTDETRTADNVGRFTHFERGSIYWHPSIGAFEVHGAIRECWQRLGSEKFGYPVIDETGNENNPGRHNNFRGFGADGAAHESSIYWSDATGAHEVYGAIRERWLELGGEPWSYLGLPTTGEMDWTDAETQKPGRISHFARGAIGWTRHDGETVEFPARMIFKSGHIGVSSVGGWAELTLTSAGTFHYRGHLHNSGFAGLSCTVGSAIKIPRSGDKVLAVKKEMSVGGTASFDSRDEDWNESGYKHDIELHWGQLMDADSMATEVDSTLGGWEFISLVLVPILGGAAVLIKLLSGGQASEYTCETSELHFVDDGNGRTTTEPHGIRCRRPERRH